MSKDTIRVTIELDRKAWEDLGVIADGLERSKTFLIQKLVRTATVNCIGPEGYLIPDAAEELGLR